AHRYHLAQRHRRGAGGGGNARVDDAAFVIAGQLPETQADHGGRERQHQGGEAQPAGGEQEPVHASPRYRELPGWPRLGIVTAGGAPPRPQEPFMTAVPRIVIAAPSSGHGKTAVAVGLLAALRERGLRPAGFKIGPDYIDAAYLGLAAGRPGRNLDPRLVGATEIAPLFAHGSAGADIAVV